MKKKQKVVVKTNKLELIKLAGIYESMISAFINNVDEKISENDSYNEETNTYIHMDDRLHVLWQTVLKFAEWEEDEFFEAYDELSQEDYVCEDCEHELEDQKINKLAN